MVGAHNALWTYGRRTGTLILPRMFECKDYKEVNEFYDNTPFPDVRVVLTGTGRVANGAAKVLQDMGFKKISPEQFKAGLGVGQVFTQLGVTDYASLKGGGKFSEQDYFTRPTDFNIDFSPFSKVADVMINGIFWDPKAPAFFAAEEMIGPAFNIKVIGDITCDIAPESSIPSTLRATEIGNPVFGYDPKKGTEVEPFQQGVVDMMTIDNLPNELPRDASEAFGQQFIDSILPELTKGNSSVLGRGTIASKGQLGQSFEYLHDYAFGE